MNELVGDFTKEDLLQLSNTISIIRQVAGGPSGSPLDGHMGLGLSVAFKKVADIGDAGVLTVGIQGIGKTASMLALKSLLHKKLYDKDKTLASIGARKKDKGDDGIDPSDQEFFTNSSVLWLSYDLSRLSDMATVNILKIVCALLTEHEIKAGTLSYDLNITNCRLSWMGACTYEIYEELWESPQWRGNFKDRLVRFHQMAYRRPIVNERIPEPSVTLNLPKIDDVKIGDAEGYAMLTEIMGSQFTDERAPLWASRLGRASAALNHRTSTTWADWKFLLLFRLNMEVERMVGYRATMTSRLMMDADALQILSETMKRGEMSPDALMDKYLISDRETFSQTVKECLSGENPLLEKAPGGKLRPGEVLMHDYVLPQQAFEIFCLQRGKEFYQP